MERYDDVDPACPDCGHPEYLYRRETQSGYVCECHQDPRDNDSDDAAYVDAIMVEASTTLGYVFDSENRGPL